MCFGLYYFSTLLRFTFDSIDSLIPFCLVVCLFVCLFCFFFLSLFAAQILGGQPFGKNCRPKEKNEEFHFGRSF